MRKDSNLKGKIIKTLIIPATTMILFVVICKFNGISFINTQGHILTLVRSTVIISFISWALSLNLNSGRFDFSIGSIALLSAMISAKITILYHLPAIVLLLLSMFIGLVLGSISGLLYVTLKLPPIITSLGVTLIYEALTFVITKGEGLLISTNLSLLEVSTTPWLIVIGLIGLGAMFCIMNFTTFGYENKALQHGQKISTSTGINEVKNAIISYALAGLLMGTVGCINLTTRGSASVALNFSSISSMFVAFLPLFIGGFIARFSEEIFGVFLGAFTSAVITLGFVRLDITSQTQSLINAIILLLFLIYLNNESKIGALIGKKK